MRFAAAGGAMGEEAVSEGGGSLEGMPAPQLAVLPGTSHFIPPGVGVLDRVDRLLPMIREFLDAPAP